MAQNEQVVEDRQIAHNESRFTVPDGTELYFQSWRPDQPRAVIMVVHGYAEHSGRYTHPVEYLVPRGYAIYALDLRGHGKSAGERAYIADFGQYLQDLVAFQSQVARREPHQKLFLLGHSMGGLIAVLYAAEHQDELAGLILSGPGLSLSQNTSPMLISLSGLVSRLAPHLALVPLDASAISRDRTVVDAYRSDPLVYNGKVKVRMGTEMLNATKRVPGISSRLRLPLLILHGSADRLADPTGSQALYEQVSSQDKTLRVYPELYHEVFNELGPDRQQVLTDLATWLDAHV
ncbi:MAG: alpha/beta hydrolase [Chloroflexi bacterium]|nr:alpha/beta hydrolase [Chloroflexota bacterium]